MKPKAPRLVPVISFNERFKVLTPTLIRDMASKQNIRFEDRESANVFLSYTSKL